MAFHHPFATAKAEVSSAWKQFTRRLIRYGWRSLPVSWRAGIIGVVAFLCLFVIFAAGALLQGLSSASGVYAVVDRIPGGQWVDSRGAVHNNEGRDAMSPEDVERARSEITANTDIMQCFGDSPDVRVANIDSLYIASPEEKNNIIRFQADLRDKAKNKPRQRVIDRVPVQGLYDPDRYRDVIRRDARRVPYPPNPMTKDASPSSLVDPKLISTQPAVVAVGTPIMHGNKATTEFNRVLDEVPKGTDPITAGTFLFVAAGGGVVNWQHFTTVMQERGVVYPIPSARQGEAINMFFSKTFDYAPYRKAVGAGLVALASEKKIDGDISRAESLFEDCDRAVR